MSPSRAPGRAPAIAVVPHRDALAGRSTIAHAVHGRTSVHPGGPRGAVVLTLPRRSGPRPPSRTTEAQQIIKIAKSSSATRGATAPGARESSTAPDSSSTPSTKAGDGKAIGKGKYRSARALYRYFKARGLASRSNPKPGDLVIWGGGTHVGIYIGKGKAISTLTSGVRVHGVHAVRARFTAYLHTGMSKKLDLRQAHRDGQGEGADRRRSARSRSARPAHDGLVNLRRGAGVGKSRIAVRGTTRSLSSSARTRTRAVAGGSRSMRAAAPAGSPSG